MTNSHIILYLFESNVMQIGLTLFFSHSLKKYSSLKSFLALEYSITSFAFIKSLSPLLKDDIMYSTAKSSGEAT